MGVLREARKKIATVMAAITVGTASIVRRVGIPLGIGAVATMALTGCGYENIEDLTEDINKDLETATENVKEGKSSEDQSNHLSDLSKTEYDFPGTNPDDISSLLENISEAIVDADIIRDILDNNSKNSDEINWADELINSGTMGAELQRKNKKFNKQIEEALADAKKLEESLKEQGLDSSEIDEIIKNIGTFQTTVDETQIEYFENLGLGGDIAFFIGKGGEYVMGTNPGEMVEDAKGKGTEIVDGIKQKIGGLFEKDESTTSEAEKEKSESDQSGTSKESESGEGSQKKKKKEKNEKDDWKATLRDFTSKVGESVSSVAKATTENIKANTDAFMEDRAKQAQEAVEDRKKDNRASEAQHSVENAQDALNNGDVEGAMGELQEGIDTIQGNNDDQFHTRRDEDFGR